MKPLAPFEYKYSFKHNRHNEFENNNPSVSLTVYNENGDILHRSNNYSDNKTHIVKINNYRYHAIKPNKSKYTKVKELLQSFPHKGLTEYILRKVIQ